MKAAKIIGILAVAYVGIVAAFESTLGYFQPQNQSTLVITTTNADGDSNERVLRRLDSNGQLFVAVNHWPRAWYYTALENPQVQITMNGETEDYLAVPATDAEHQRLASEFPQGWVFRTVVGFPPRYFVRLDPRRPLTR